MDTNVGLVAIVESGQEISNISKNSIKEVLIRLLFKLGKYIFWYIIYKKMGNKFLNLKGEIAMKTTKSKMLKKIIAFFLATLILCSSIPMQVFAAGINLGQQVSRTTINVKAEKKYGHEIHTTKVNGEKPLTVMVKGFCFGRGRRTWTLGTRFWRPLLYQLSYTPIGGPSGTRTPDRPVMSRWL